MKVIYQDAGMCVLRFDRGEAVMTQLVTFCERAGIQGAHFTAIGAVSEVSVAWYDVNQQEYETREYHGLWEIASLTGNVALKDGAVMVHAHGVFTLPDESVGGHVMSLTVGAVCEVFMTILPGSLERAMDDGIGLAVLESMTLRD